jgi:ring-1,2-phenylacetyl-CoA epoxidase subunit PaaE
MARFHSLKVKDIRRETAESVSVEFEVPPQQQPEYQFKQGQYITLKLNINGEELRRSYSICAAPHEKELRVAIKEVTGGKVSTYINRELSVGSSMEVMTPMGTFHSILMGSNKKHYVLFAGGSGITPMMSILKSILYIEKSSTITLFYANKNEEGTIFKRTLDDIQAAHANLKIVYVFEQGPAGTPDLQTGMISKEKCLALLENFGGVNADEFFICGPGPMMENVKLGLESLKVANEKVHIEYFSAVVDAVKKAESGNDLATLGDNVKAKIKVIQYGVETDFELEGGSISILDAAIEAGVDAPFSCKGGVCCTCRGKILEGKVKMITNFALTESEVAEGFVLTCQSHPITEKVVVDYDA